MVLIFFHYRSRHSRIPASTISKTKAN